MSEMKIKLPLELIISGRIWLKEFGSVEYKGYYGDFLLLKKAIEDMFGIDSYGIEINYMEHIENE